MHPCPAGESYDAVAKKCMKFDVVKGVKTTYDDSTGKWGYGGKRRRRSRKKRRSRRRKSRRRRSRRRRSRRRKTKRGGYKQYQSNVAMSSGYSTPNPSSILPWATGPGSFSKTGSGCRDTYNHLNR